MRAISELPGADTGHPCIDVRLDGVTVRLITLTGNGQCPAARAGH